MSTKRGHHVNERRAGMERNKASSEIEQGGLLLKWREDKTNLGEVDEEDMQRAGR